MLGECAWVSNARANPNATVVRFGRHPVRLVPIADRAAIIQAYLRVAPGARPYIGLGASAALEACARVAADHPVFRVARQAPSD
jgi:hypothetical protein